MWIIFSIAVGMSLITYLKEGDFGLWDNILNAVDLLYVVSVSIAVAIWGDLSSKITKFDKGCLLVVLLIVVFWIYTQNHLLTNFLIQSILVIAYFPVVKRMIQTREITESMIIWSGMLLAPILSLLSTKGLLAIVYSVRAIICVGLLLLLMLWIKFKNTRKVAG